MSFWTDSVIWWQVYPFGFVGAERHALPPDSAARHRLPKLLPWLDYLVELGCNGLALGPVFASQTHGYDVIDHFRIDPRIGDDTDIDELIAACHLRGIRVLFDGVFHHVGRGHAGFVDVQQRRQNSDHARWFHIDWDTPGHDGFGYRTFEGHGALVALNHDEPAVAQYVIDVMTHWLGRGIDGWRLDAAYAVPLPFWRHVTTQVRDRFPDAWFVGEVIHGDFPTWVVDGGLDSVTQYELWKSIWSSLNDGNFFELSWTLERHRDFCKVFSPLTFVGNHDVTRIASKLTDPDTLPHALVLLFTLPGVPSIYYGDEQGFRGVKEDREGGDDEVRPAFPATPDALSRVGKPIFGLHQELIGLRRREPWLSTGRLEVATLNNEQLSYRVTGGDGAAVLVLLNIADEPFDFDIDVDINVDVDVDGDVIGATEVLAVDDSGKTAAGVPDDRRLTVGGHGWAVVRVVG